MLRHISRFARSPVEMGKFIVAVVGSTGVGKSDFAISLAEKINGEIINADSLQVYKGMDIATNKVTLAERTRVPHHLLDFLDPSTKAYSVYDFKRDAASLISDLHERGKIPVFVGGTHYYLQYLLFGPQSEANLRYSNSDTDAPITPEQSEKLYERLLRENPKAAARLHKNDYRRITRALSKEEQDSIKMQQNIWTEEPCFPVLVFWLCGEGTRQELDQKLDRRVERMIEDGLVEEVVRDAENARKTRHRGVGVAIGVKELEEYVNEIQQVKPHDDVVVQRLLAQGIEKIKIATRRYSRSQSKYLRRVFLPACLKAASKGHRVHVEAIIDVKSVFECVETVRMFIECKEISQKSAELDKILCDYEKLKDQVRVEGDWKKYFCNSCQKECNGKHEYLVHLASRGHGKIVAKRD